jgi:flavin reductase (DIM6/NTAB) family NADH-FMN oxidoreductase RutF
LVSATSTVRGRYKFDQFDLTAQRATKVSAPMIAECFANIECKLIDTRLINRYSLFVFQAVRAHVASTPKYPTTIHYRGDGVFMVAGRSASWKKKFKPDRL